ncbi:IS200/IS605 family element transposase accessory protein TnpB [Planktothrix sp. FACHB-1355]|uniref:IS200/IS605 family element transposase accessory protein TnpB n=1 Tax=Aerosakkonema funiforme FACHB-1375 TaxID=2949571 RepID=A0A926VME8_9CYAN|nr:MULTISPECIES: RNA-guided endonuclease TnpB family protein [Oscillatoriales]MBD2185174.1 IS200/IS605 family element transposase accessory protein TnpB [Aerosakkonema funiforme FACHB-1375]MBD3558740.1 IS200/IS605 family element transposase accessory protein TnpB [Planktothrix sp. FACHB-1355]
MLVFEAKLEGASQQYERLDEAINTARFVRNSCLRYWMDNKNIGKYDLSAYCAVLGKEFAFAGKLNSQARQASAERAWSAISRFYDNCKKKKPGNMGFPRFKKHQTHGCVEYKTTGWKLSEDRRTITFSDGFEAGSFKLWGTRDLHFYQLKQIKRVRVVRRADGYYVQFCIDQERVEKREPTGKTIGLDVGLTHFYSDSNGQTIENPRHLRKSEKALKRLNRRLSRTRKGSNNRAKSRNRLSRKHLKVSRQRKDFAVKLARCVVQSNDLVAYEDLQVRNMVKNHKLSKSISDAAWSNFRNWLEYFGKVFGVVTVAVPPHYTSQNCSNCGEVVKKSLSQRTHRCPHCGHMQDRDWNAAINILELGLRTVGHTATLNASGDIDLCLGEETPPGKSSRGKRKPKQ